MSKSNPARPNILLIMADQQRVDCRGGKRVPFVQECNSWSNGTRTNGLETQQEED